MKIMVISKKTLIWAATVLLVIVAAIAFAAVSYTHLTLPTICSV
mgnify:CR=1 FL=1